MFFVTLFGGIFTAFFGWCGGRGHAYWERHQNWPKWILESWVRDWLIGPVCAILAVIYGVHSWWILAIIPPTGGALSTYWKRKGKANFWLHGFMVGIAAFPIAIITGQWWMFAARAVLLAVWMGFWSGLIGDADLEEAGRYFPVGATMWMVC